MKQICKLTSLLAVLALVTLSCNRETLSTDQYDSAIVKLHAYGPQPVVRGGVLRFVGSNLDKVTAVILPDNIEITDIEVVSPGVHSEIRVTVPKDGPVVGYPKLIAGDAELVGKTRLSYSEPITIDSVNPSEALPGQEITISGDYLNLIHEVIFTDKVKVSEKNFKSHSRYAIKVAVPAEAQTGKIGLGTVDESATTDENLLASLNIVETETELVVTTAKGKVAKASYKAGETVNIGGTNLNLTRSVKLEGATVTDFTASATALSFPLPATAKDGDVMLVMASGVEVKAGSITTVMPTVTACTPQPVLPGAQLTLTGTDLDLVSTVEVPAVSADNAWPDIKNTAPTSLAFNVPADATGSDIVLHLANGNTVEVSYTLVQPTITAIDPLAITAGDAFVLTGTDFQLVKSVMVGDQACEFTLDSETQITVATTAATQSGKVVLVLTSGKKVSSSDELSVKAAGKVQVSSLPASASVGDEVTMEGEGFMAIESIYFGETKITAYSERTDSRITFTIPVELETGSYTPHFILTTGEEEICAMSIEVKGMITTIVLFEGEKAIGTGWDGGNAIIIGGDAFGKVPYGASIHFEYDLETADYHMFQFCYNSAGGWAKFMEQSITGTTSFVWTPTKEEYDRMYSEGLVIFGYAWILHKAYITYENQSYIPVMVGDVMLVDWDEHGGHNGYWDQPDGWGGVKTELVWKAEGDLYLKVTEGGSDSMWTVCCNHQANYSENVPHWAISDASKYVINVDIMLEGDASAADMTFNPVLGDKWPGGKEAGLFPATTGGKWITVTIDPGMSGELDCSSGINGFMAAGVPAGLCIDNYRLSLK